MVRLMISAFYISQIVQDALGCKKEEAGNPVAAWTWSSRPCVPHPCKQLIGRNGMQLTWEVVCQADVTSKEDIIGTNALAW